MWNDEEILRECLKGNSKAQRLLYEKYAPVLLGISIRFTGNRSEAEDVLQESFVKIFNNLGHFRHKSPLIGWMRRIVINTAITVYHRNLKHRHYYDLEEFGEINIGEKDIGEIEYTRDELLLVISGLPPGYKMVFNLYAIEGYKHKEIAKKMNIDINTSKSQYSRAKKLIQHKLSTLRRVAGKIDEQAKEPY